MAAQVAGRSTKPHVVVVGGGFGGLYAARKLAGMPVRITLVDRRNHHLFQPLLYQVATAALSPGDIAVPIRGILGRHHNVRVLLSDVTAIDLANRRIAHARGDLSYDYLIVASGASHSYFGHPEWEPMAPGLKTLEDALDIRRRLLIAFEAAECESDPQTVRALLTFVVVGGGPTGVELAGALAEIARHTLKGQFRSIDPASARVLLLEGAPRVLPPYPEDLSRSAERQLRALGVEVRTGALVTDITPSSVRVGDEMLPTHTVLWAAGVAASPLGKTLGVPLDRSGRVVVAPDLTVPGHPEAYVIGDLASASGPDGKPLPGLATVAIQMGEAAARNIALTAQGRPREPFHYDDRGIMATIGRQSAVAVVKGTHVSGVVAWLLWLSVHVFSLIRFENRALVMMKWLWSYAISPYYRGARLITGDRPRGLG
jgi:NADH:ubiquinone reductase (H+-translocating)